MEHLEPRQSRTSQHVRRVVSIIAGVLITLISPTLVLAQQPEYRGRIGQDMHSNCVDSLRMWKVGGR